MGPVISEDNIHGLSAVGEDVWDENLGGKISFGMVVTSTTDTDEDHGMAIQQEPSCGPHSQTYEGTGSRTWPLNRIVGSNKTDANSLMSSHSAKVISGNDMDVISLPNDSVDGSCYLQQELIITKGKHKAGSNGIGGCNKMDLNSLQSSVSAQAVFRNDLDGIALSNERRDHVDRLPTLAASSDRIIGSYWMDVNSLLSSGSSQVIPQYDMGDISIANETRDSASGMQEQLIRTEGKHNLNIQDEARMTGVLMNSSCNIRQPLVNVAWDQLPSSNKVLALSGAVNHKLPWPERPSSFPISWNELPSSFEVQTLSGTINHTCPLLTGSALSPIAWNQLPSSNKAIGSAPCPTTWDQLPSSHEVQSLSWTVNNKHPLPAESASYPVVQGIYHQPLDICCTGRANVLFPGSNFDNSHLLADCFPGSDAGTRLEPTESSGGTLLSLDVPYNTPCLERESGEIQSTSEFLKNEEIVTADGKCDESANEDERHKGILNPVNRVASTVLPGKKRVSSKIEIEDGIPRQARSGRCSKRSKAHLSFVKELEHGETSKPFRSGRSCSDKHESKIGHPSKVLDCKAYGCPDKLIVDEQELIAAANAARNASHAACSSYFWKIIEPLFSSADPKYIQYVMQLGEEGCAELPLPIGSFSAKLQGSQRNMGDNNKDVDSVFSEIAGDEHKGTDDGVESAFDHQKCTAVINFGSLNSQNLVFADDLGHENNTSEHSDNVLFQSLSQTSSDRLQNSGADFSAVLNGCCKEGVSLHEKVLMEQPSMDIQPRTGKEQSVEEDSEIDKELAELKLRLSKQVNYRKSQLDKLEKPMKIAKEIEDRNLEQLALNKLVEMAYQKLMDEQRACDSSHKMGKGHALPFVMQTLARCKKFEETGKSCFSEPAFHEILVSTPPHCSNGNGRIKIKRTANQMMIHRSASRSVTRETQVKLSSRNAARNLARNPGDKLLLDAVDSMEILDLADGLGAPGQDIGSWLNMTEDPLDDDEAPFGLDVPMDNLPDLNSLFR